MVSPSEPSAQVRGVKWPGEARCAVMLTFDFDAETIWLARDPANANRKGILSQGHYGAKVGVPRVLELLREEALTASFYVPGWVADHYPRHMEAIAAGGHEIGHHGYLHHFIDPAYPDKERESLEMGLESLQRTVGVVPVGYRAPTGEISDHVLQLLAEKGFLYDTTLMDDVMPYRHRLANGKPGVVELPWHWAVDDAPYLIFSMAQPRPIFTNSHILEIWMEAFKELYRWGGLVNVLCHPQAIGRPGRIEMLRQFIAFVRGYPDVWFATGKEVAEAYLELNER